MEIHYPIFIVDRDGWIKVIETVDKIQTEIEAIDVEDNEYIVWDRVGLPLKLYLDDKVINVKPVSDEPQLNVLKEAILCYVRIARPKVPFTCSAQENDMVKLFKTVEDHVKDGSIMRKIKRLFKCSCYFCLSTPIL